MIRTTSGGLLATALAAVALTSCGGADQSAGKPGGDDAQAGRVALLLPGKVTVDKTAPDLFRVNFETSKGDFVIEVHRDWAPNGADRFYYLVKNGFYDQVRFFRVISGFMAQFGLSGDPKLSGVWRDFAIPDDSVKQSNTRGMVTFAKAGPNSRTTQVFISYRDNSGLDRDGFAPFGRVIQGMEVVDQLHSGYGDSPPGGRGPTQTRIRNEGNAYLERDFPQLDFVKKATILP
jgi:peptidyl-prolyl cis-trans isomerase A (cyclophilin A)